MVTPKKAAKSAKKPVCSAATGSTDLGLQPSTLQLLPPNAPLSKTLLRILRQIEATQDPLIKQHLQRTFEKHVSQPPRAGAGQATAAVQGKKRIAAASIVATSQATKRHASAKTGLGLGAASTILALPSAQPTEEELARRAARAARFKGAGGPSSSQPAELLVDRVESGRYGTSTTLEKEYLRLTALPSSADVRPPKVLREALNMVKNRWADRCTYEYACTQLKSIRQDLCVQKIQGPLAIDAYEIHARVAIEVGDLPELRQCIAVLKQLYTRQAEGVLSCANAPEFYAYSVLAAAGQEPRVLSTDLAAVPPQLLQHPSVQHALQVVTALRSGHYVSFIQLYGSAPRMAPYLMDQWLPRVRQQALRVLLAAYHPTAVPLTAVGTALGLEDVQEVVAFCRTHGAVVDIARSVLDTKASRAAGTAAAQHMAARQQH